MSYDTLNKLIVSLETSGYEMFWKYDDQFFMLFYDKFKSMPYANIPDSAYMFMEIHNWKGMSQRCGVWQYYESGALNYNYPEEWIDESNKIDIWISDHEIYLYKWMYNLILEYKSEILKLGEE